MFCVSILFLRRLRIRSIVHNKKGVFGKVPNLLLIFRKCNFGEISIFLESETFPKRRTESFYILQQSYWGSNQKSSGPYQIKVTKAIEGSSRCWLYCHRVNGCKAVCTLHSFIAMYPFIATGACQSSKR